MRPARLTIVLHVPLQLKESKRAVNSLRDFVDDDDDDDLERVSWTGEPVGSKLKRQALCQ